MFAPGKWIGAGQQVQASGLEPDPETVPILAGICRPGLILPGLAAATGMEVLRHLSAALAREELLVEPDRFFDLAMRREGTCSTIVSPGWAMPHVRGEAVAQLALAVATCVHPVDWFGQAAVRCVFLFAVPEAEAMTYMLAVSAVARLMQDPAQRAVLETAREAAAVYRLLAEARVKTPTGRATQQNGCEPDSIFQTDTTR